MASQQPAPPPPAPTAITALGDDLLREIFLHLPALPSLVRAAFACRAFLRAVSSSPAFRRSFRELHAPPLLALFIGTNYEVVPASPCPWRLSDPDLVAADFFNTRAPAPGWEIRSNAHSFNGNLGLVSSSGNSESEHRRIAAYNPFTRTLDLFLYRPGLRAIDIHLAFHAVPSSADGQGPSRVLCIRHHRRRSEGVAVFSSDTMEWQILPQKNLGLREHDRAQIGAPVHGLIWWQNWMYDQIVVLDTATFQFSLIDVPEYLKTDWDETTYKLGETKDEKLCIVDIKGGTLVSFFLASDAVDIAVERWTMYKEFPLHPIVKEFTGFSMEEEGCYARVELVAVIDGFVYLSIFYVKDTQSRELYISLCLETSEMSELFHDAYRYNEEVNPYVMAWPPSLLQSKEDSEAEVTGDRVADGGPVGTKEASSILVTALQSLSQALKDGSESNKELLAELDAFLLDSTNETAVELGAFLRPTEHEKDSLTSRITTLDAQLITARDRILRISV